MQWPWKLAKENSDLKFEIERSNASLLDRIHQVNKLTEQLSHRDSMIADQTKCLGSYASTIETLRSQLHGQETQTRKYRDECNALSEQLDEAIERLGRCKADLTAHLDTYLATPNHRGHNKYDVLRKQLADAQNVITAIETIVAHINPEPSTPNS